MKVFLSWSGELSRKIAEVFSDWLPVVLTYVEPTISTKDLGLGAEWPSRLGKDLQEAACCIVFCTKQNLDAKWIHFEAGASKKIIPFLFDVRPNQVTGPLRSYQAITYSREEVSRMVKGIAKLKGETSENNHNSSIENSLKVCWPFLEKQLSHLYYNGLNNSFSDYKQEVVALGDVRLKSAKNIFPTTNAGNNNNKNRRFSYGFFNRAIEDSIIENDQSIVIEIAQHSAWGTFRPKGNQALRLNEATRKISPALLSQMDKLDLDGDLWPNLIQVMKERADLEVNFSIILIPPRSFQADLIAEAQETKEEEKGRDQNIDPFFTLFTINRIINHCTLRNKIKFEVKLAKNLIMTYSLSRIADHLLVDFYDYKSLRTGVPCAWYKKSLNKGHFDLFSQELDKPYNSDLLHEYLHIDFEHDRIRALAETDFSAFKATMGDLIKTEFR